MTSDTWTLDDPVSSVELVAAANARFKQIVVTYMSASSDKLSAPVFSPTAGSYYGAQTITLSGSANATIYYSLDGENYNVYTEPFQIEETSTVYAYSKVEEKTSDIVTAVYTIIPIVTYNSITDLAAACTATSANDAPVVKLSARLVVTYVNGQNTFVSDGERGFLIYGTNTQYTTVGTVLSGSIEGKLYAYKNLKELAITDGWANVTPGAEFSGVTPGDATISALLGNADGYESSLVKINKVNFEANALTSRSVTVMDEEGDELTLYDKFNVLSATSFNTSDQYNITGFLARNGENVEFGVTAIEAVPKNVAAPTFNIETGTYEVDQIRVVDPANLKDIQIVPGKDYCTLVTCTPYGINTHRLLVRGHRIANLQGNARVTADAIQIDTKYVAPFVAAPILLILLVLMLFDTRKSKQHR